MALRGKKPDPVQKRLKMFMFGPAGIGKTTAAIQFPNSYIIDCEKGSENYDELINGSNSVVFHTTDINEAISEVKGLLTEKHDYRTLVIDPITPLYNDLLDKSEQQVGSEFGRHYGAANKTMKRLANLIMALDMNVVITAHAKAEYGEGLKKIGYTFDGWKQLDYWFDLVVELRKQGKKRIGKIVKTRIKSFPDDGIFEWSYTEIENRYGAEVLGKQADTITLAAPEQVKEIKDLLNVVKLPDGTVDKWFSKANVETWDDIPAETIVKCIDYIKNRLASGAAAA